MATPGDAARRSQRQHPASLPECAPPWRPPPLHRDTAAAVHCGPPVPASPAIHPTVPQEARPERRDGGGHR